MNWLFIAVSFSVVFVAVFLFLLPRSLSFAGKMRQEGCSTSHAAGRHLGVFSPSWNASAQLVKLCTPQCAWLLKRLAFQKWKNWPPFGTKLWTATEKQSSAWMRKGYGNPGRVSFQLGLRFLCHAQLLAELSKQRWIRVATQNSRATVLIIQQTATSSKLQPY